MFFAPNIPPVKMLPRKAQPAAKAYIEARDRAAELSLRRDEAEHDRAKEAAAFADRELLRQAKPEDVGHIGTPNQDARVKQAAALRQAAADQQLVVQEAAITLGRAFLEHKDAIAAAADKAPEDASKELIDIIERYVEQRGAFETALNFRAWAAAISDNEPIPHFGEVDEQTSYSGEYFHGLVPTAKDMRANLIKDALRHEDLRKREVEKAEREERNAAIQAASAATTAQQLAREDAELQEQAKRKAAFDRQRAEADAMAGVYVKLDGTVVPL